MVIYAQAEYKSYNFVPITILNQICSHFMHNTGQWGTEHNLTMQRLQQQSWFQQITFSKCSATRSLKALQYSVI